MSSLIERAVGARYNTPKSVLEAFGTFDSNISIDPIERAKAEALHREVEGVIKAAGIAEATFMQGSFSRKTMRKPLKDVDVVALLPESMAEKWKTPNGALQVHELFKKPLVDHFGDRVRFDEVTHAGKALQLCFENRDFTIDLVAAFAEPDEWIEIADRHEGAWVPSNTRQLMRTVRERNQKTDGRFVHQVRMVKEFKAQHAALDDVCGLVIESLTFVAVTEKLPHALAVAKTLRHAATAVLGPVMDPTGFDDLSVKWTADERSNFAQTFTAGARRAEEAVRLERNGQITAAIEVWSSVLGEDFPKVPPQSYQDAIAALAAGSVTSTGRATKSHVAAVESRPTRAWRCR